MPSWLTSGGGSFILSCFLFLVGFPAFFLPLSQLDLHVLHHAKYSFPIPRLFMHLFGRLQLILVLELLIHHNWSIHVPIGEELLVPHIHHLVGSHEVSKHSRYHQGKLNYGLPFDLRWQGKKDQGNRWFGQRWWFLEWTSSLETHPLYWPLPPIVASCPPWVAPRTHLYESHVASVQK